MIVAVLHDVVEDTSWTLEGLKKEGFSSDVLEAVDAMTRRSNETYDEFVDRALSNAVAREVKIADLEDNMDLKRIASLTEKDLERLQRYHRAWSEAVKNEGNVPTK